MWIHLEQVISGVYQNIDVIWRQLYYNVIILDRDINPHIADNSIISRTGIHPPNRRVERERVKIPFHKNAFA